MDAIAKDALQWACADDENSLRSHFEQKKLTFSRDLLQPMQGRQCHIYYESTIPAFRVSSESQPVTGLFANVNTLAFLAHREETVGDSLDILKTILTRTGQPLKVLVDVSVPYNPTNFAPALRFHFGDAKHVFQFHEDTPGDVDPWIQDYLKHGSVAGQPKVLVSRLTFEGSSKVGKMLGHMLDSYKEPMFTRSKLSFEGGDLLFSFVPGGTGKLTMFYGTSAKQYWGEALSRAEFEYVLKTEFGAEEAIYFGDVTPHVDYSLSLLPDGRTAMVVEPVCGDPSLAESAVDLLLQTYRNPTPPELLRLEKLVDGGRLAANKREVVQQTLAASRAQKGWKYNDESEAKQKIAAYVNENCPHDARECISPTRIPQLIERHLPMVRSWIHLGASVRRRESLALRLLEIIRRQATGCDQNASQKLIANAKMLSQMGYHVIRVPWLEGDGSSKSPWPGVSYANAAIVGKTVFLPKLGLGRKEQDWVDELQKQLPEPYDAVAAPASALVLENGGIHCALAFGRDVAGSP